MTENTIIYGEVLGAGLLADIALPTGDGPHPVLLGVHGGRWHYSNRSQLGIAIDVNQWAERGFFALSVEYRLVTCTPAPACYQDVLCAIRWVHAHADEYHLDRERIYLTGMSAGGHLVSFAATLGQGPYMQTGGWEDQPCDFRAAISVSGAYDLLKLDWACGWITPGVPWDTARRLAARASLGADQADADIPFRRRRFHSRRPGRADGRRPGRERSPPLLFAL